MKKWTVVYTLKDWWERETGEQHGKKKWGGVTKQGQSLRKMDNNKTEEGNVFGSFVVYLSTIHNS